MRLASFSACSGRKVTIAFTFGFTRSIWAMYARSSSTAESLRVRSSLASLRAGVKTREGIIGVRHQLFCCPIGV
jgi:hypothetical protein